MIVVIILLLCSVLTSVSTAATFHVAKEHPSASDFNACADNQNAPKQTIVAGQACIQGPGDTLYIHQGDYRPQIVGYNNDQRFPSGTAAQPILIAVWPGDTVTVGGINAVTNWQQGQIAHVIFDGFRTNGGGASMSGYESSFITLRNCEITGAGGNGIEWFTLYENAHHMTLQNCNVHHNGHLRLDHGIYALTPDSLIENNEFHHNSGYGIHWYYEPDLGAVGDRTIIRNNRVYDNGHATDGEAGQVTINYSDSVQFYNNIVYKTTPPNLSNGGVGISRRLANSKVYNNTIYGFPGSGLSFGGGSIGTNNEVRNNIFANNSQDINPANDNGMTYSTNLCGSSDAYTHCTGGNPQFENAAAGNFKILQGSPARNAGTSLPLVATSYAGPPGYESLSRPQPQGGAWDIGAYEYAEGGPPPPFDFSLSMPNVQNVTRGSSVGVTISASLNQGTPESLAFSVGSLPSGVTSGISNTPCTPNCTINLTLTASGSATLGQATVTVTATGATKSHSTSFQLVVGSQAAAGATFYTDKEGVGGHGCSDGNGGGINDPFCTIAKGLSMLGPGKTLYIRQGVYFETIDTKDQIASGTGWGADQMVMVAGYQNEIATIRATTNVDPFVVSSYGSNRHIEFIRFENIEVDGAGIGGGISVLGNCTTGCGQGEKEVRDIRFVRMHVHNTRTNCTPFDDTKRTVTIFAYPHRVDFLNSDIHHANCGRYGFYMEGFDHIIEGNTIHDNEGYGIQIQFDGCSGGQCPRGIHIRNNTFYGNGIIHNAGSPSDRGSLTIGNVPDGQIYVYNNVFHHNQAGPGVLPYSSAELYNNTSYANVNDGMGHDAGGSGHVIFRNNISYGNGGRNFNFDGSHTESNNLETDPNFMNAGGNDFHIKTPSPAINGGTDVALVTTDIEGTARPAGQNTIGAYQFQAGGTPFDFTLSSPAPQSVVQGASVSFAITATLSTGTATAVNWSVTSGLPAGASASVSNSPCTPTCTANILIATLTSTPVASSTLVVTAAGGGQTHTRNVTLNVTAGVPASAQPIYLRCPGPTGSSNNFSCIDAEDPAKAKATLTGSNGALSCMVLAGKVLYVEGSGCSYTEEWDSGTLSITGGNGPSYTTATRIEGYGSTPPVFLSPTATSGITFFLRNANDKFLIIKNLVVDAANKAGNAVAIFGPAHHIHFEQVSMRNTVNAPGGAYEPLYLLGASDIELVDVFVSGGGMDGITLEGSLNNFLMQRVHLLNNVKGVNIVSGGTKTNITMNQVEVRNNSSHGIDIGTTTGVVVQNALVHSNGGTGVWIRGTAQGTSVYNSTIYANAATGLKCDAGATGAQIKDNIVYANTLTGVPSNVINNCGALSNNFETNPQFLGAPNDFKLNVSTSGAVDTGESIPSVTTDYEGTQRPIGQQDYGAYEQTRVPTIPGEDTTVAKHDVRQALMLF